MKGTLKLIMLIAVLTAMVMLLLLIFEFISLESLLGSLRYVVPTLLVLVGGTFAIGVLSKDRESDQSAADESHIR